MAGLKLKHIYKVYPNGAKAVSDFCMDIEDKEFIVFVGPSGCGKSTTLRMIAGLEEITAGELYIGDELVNDVEPKNRDIAMVFQNYALYPHMTVYENMAFGLRLHKMPKDEIDRRVKEAAEILGITEYLKRKPAAMSGGQRQRVALGRAIVREPKVFLLDEPLSNLDAKLRTQMRSEISKLHQKIRTTFIYVTHDQVEAMTMGTRIVVMKDGFVQQIDTSRNLYSYPINKFVAGFIGTPQMNFYDGKLKKQGDEVRVTFNNTEVDMTAPYEYFVKADSRYLDGERDVVLGIRLEHISVDPEQYPFKAKCRVSYVEDLGIDSQVYAEFNFNSEETITDSATKVIIKAPAGAFYRTGDVIDISMDLSKLHIFDKETEETICPRVPLQTIAEGRVSGNKLYIFGSETELPPAVRPQDGVYELHIPTSAFSLGGNIKAEFVNDEEVNGRRLVQMRAEGMPIFSLAEKDADTSCGVSIDWKYVSFFKDGERVVSPLPEENEFHGRIVKQKAAKETADKGKKRTKIVYKLEIAGKLFECADERAERIISGGGGKIFDSLLSIRTSPADIAVAEDGILVEVVRVLDYGNEKFAECRFKEVVNQAKKKSDGGEQAEQYTTVYVAVGNSSVTDKIFIVPDISESGVYEMEQNIRLV